MAAKTIKHNDHEHNLRSVNEEVAGLKIDDRSSDRISEAFGWSDEKFQKVLDTYNAFEQFQDATENLDEDLPRSTKISTLAEFLKSPSFKKLAVKIETPNDYFILGYIFSASLFRHKLEDLKEAFPNMIGGPISGGDLLRLLKELAERGKR